MLIGKFVSESKFRSNPAAFIPHIQNTNREALAALITKPEVERKLLHRVRNKARLYGQDFGADGQPLSSANGTNESNGANGYSRGGSPVSVGFPGGKIDVDSVVELYEHYIIPLTKEVEVSGVFLRNIGNHSQTDSSRSTIYYRGSMEYPKARLTS